MQAICTIIAPNYLPQAFALIASIRVQYPATPFFLLVTDECNAENIESQSINWVKVGDLPIGNEELDWLSSYYDVVEFATALKPFLLRHLLNLNFSSVVFLDPDMILLSKIDDVFSIAERGSIVLTPHRISPTQVSSLFYTDSTFLQFGTFNLGFVAVGQASISFLEWWASKLLYFSTRHVEDLYFTDQKWINLAPAYFDCTIIKDPGLNLAPWNLDERSLNFVEGVIYANGVPLRLIHFSQMSATLAKGLSTDLWRTTVMNKEATSVKIIESLTDSYSQTLISLKNTLNLESQHYERRQTSALFKILKLANHRVPHKKSLLWGVRMRLINLTKHINLFDQSATYSSLIRNIPKDYSKIRNRLFWNRSSKSRYSRNQNWWN